MGSRIENLGDYNKVREDLQAEEGSLDKLYRKVGDIAVAKAAPKLMFEGGVITVGVLTILSGLGFAGYKGIQFVKDRKTKIKGEPFLKKKFAEIIKDEPTMSDNGNKNEDLKETRD